MPERESFRVEGTGCWCPDNMTLQVARVMGHTKDCTEARRAWRLNMQHFSEMGRQRSVDEEVGRQVREAASAALVPEEAPR